MINNQNYISNHNSFTNIKPNYTKDSSSNKYNPENFKNNLADYEHFDINNQINHNNFIQTKNKNFPLPYNFNKENLNCSNTNVLKSNNNLIYQNYSKIPHNKLNIDENFTINNKENSSILSNTRSNNNYSYNFYGNNQEKFSENKSPKNFEISSKEDVYKIEGFSQLNINANTEQKINFTEIKNNEINYSENNKINFIDEKINFKKNSDQKKLKNINEFVNDSSFNNFYYSSNFQKKNEVKMFINPFKNLEKENQIINLNEKKSIFTNIENNNDNPINKISKEFITKNPEYENSDIDSSNCKKNKDFVVPKDSNINKMFYDYTHTQTKEKKNISTVEFDNKTIKNLLQENKEEKLSLNQIDNITTSNDGKRKIFQIKPIKKPLEKEKEIITMNVFKRNKPSGVQSTKKYVENEDLFLNHTQEKKNLINAAKLFTEDEFDSLNQAEKNLLGGKIKSSSTKTDYIGRIRLEYKDKECFYPVYRDSELVPEKFRNMIHFNFETSRFDEDASSTDEMIYCAKMTVYQNMILDVCYKDIKSIPVINIIYNTKYW